MAQLVFAMNQSLDGYVDYDRFAPGPGLFRHFIDRVGSEVFYIASTSTSVGRSLRSQLSL